MSNVNPVAVKFAAIRKNEVAIDAALVDIAGMIIPYLDTVYRVVTGKGDGEVAHLVKLRDMFKVQLLPNSKPDSAFPAAMNRVLLAEFGIEDFPNFVGQWLRAWRLAMGKDAGLLTFVGKRVSMPLTSAVNVFDDKGDLTSTGKAMVKKIQSIGVQKGKDVTEAAAIARLKKENVVCVGGDHPVYAVKVPAQTKASEIAGAALVKLGMAKDNGTRTSRTDGGTSFLKSVDFAATQLAALMSDKSDEAGFAPSDAVNAKLVALGDLIDAYLEADVSKPAAEPQDVLPLA